MEHTIETQIKSIRDEIVGKLGAGETERKAMQTQLDALERAVQTREVGSMGSANQLKDLLTGNASVQALLENKRGAALIRLTGDDTRLIESKTTITATAAGYGVTGVMPLERIAGITSEARQRLTVRGLLSSSPTTQALVDFVRVLSPLSIASPQTEASDKAQNALTFESKSEKVQTLATWVPASRQILDDLQELSSFLQSGLLYYTNLAEELQLLAGSGSGNDLNGLITQGDAFSTSLLGSSWTRLDVIGHAIEQITTAKEIPPTFCVLHPYDWWKMRLLKNSLGNYILGDPQTVVSPSLFGLSVVPTCSIASGTFLVGSGDSEACEIRDRQEALVEISTEHSDYFIKNLVAVRCEKRLALVVRRPHSFIRGSFSSSPA